MASLQIAAAVKAKLDDLAASLAKTLGDNLVALVVHGSAVRGGWRDGSSDVDLICVVRDDAEAILAAIGPALELARMSARIETMILTSAEIPRSADCFPLLYGDVARTGVAIHGTSPFASLAISDAHKRLRIEQELREIRIRMRRLATDVVAASSFGGAVERKLKQARGPLWALLALRGEGKPGADKDGKAGADSDGDDLAAVLRGAGAAYKLDVAPLGRVRENPKEAFSLLARLLDAALADVDAREVT